MQGYVYLLQEQDFSGTPTGLYKIGKTTQKSISDRTKQYKAGNARPVVEHYAVAVADCQQVETALHREYKRYRLSAGGDDEWFRLDGRMVADVMQNMRSYGTKRQPFRTNQVKRAPSGGRRSPYSRGRSLIFWALAGAGALWLFSAMAGSADIVVGRQYKLQQHPYKGCPAERQPCNGSNVWSDDYRVIGTIKNGAIVTVTSRPQDPKYTEVTFANGLRGWVYTESLKLEAK
jgi:hypothetical protein